MTALDIIGAQYDHMRTAARQIDAEHRALKEAKLEAISREFDALVLRAIQEGASISAIAREMGTTNRARVYNSRDRALAFSSALPDVDPLADRYSWAGEQIQVTLTEYEAREVLDNYGQTATNPPLTAVFHRTEHGWTHNVSGLLPAGHEHPVALWFQSDANRNELNEWSKR